MSDEKSLPVTKAQLDLLVACNTDVQQAVARLNLLREMLFAQHGIFGDWQIVSLNDGESPQVILRGPDKPGVGSL